MAQTKKSLREVWNSMGGLDGLWDIGCEEGNKLRKHFKLLGAKPLWLSNYLYLGGLILALLGKFFTSGSNEGFLKTVSCIFIPLVRLEGFYAFPSAFASELGTVPALLLPGIVGSFSFYLLFGMRAALYGNYKTPSWKNTIYSFLFVGAGFLVLLVLLLPLTIQPMPLPVPSPVNFKMILLLVAVRTGFFIALATWLFLILNFLTVGFVKRMSPTFDVSYIFNSFRLLPFYWIALVSFAVRQVWAYLAILILRALPYLVLLRLWVSLWVDIAGPLGIVSLSPAHTFILFTTSFVKWFFAYYYIIMPTVQSFAAYYISFVGTLLKSAGLVPSGSDENHLKEDGSDDQ